MGLFDTFEIEYNEKKYGLQTKRLGRSMEHYSMGDPVLCGSPGVHVYYDHFFLDKNGNHVYVDEDEISETGMANKTVFIIISFGVYADFEIHNYLGSQEERDKVTKRLLVEWNDTYRIIDLLSRCNRKSKLRFESASRCINTLSGLLDYVEDPVKLEELRKEENLRFTLHERRMMKGKDPLQLIREEIAQFHKEISDETLGQSISDNRL